MHMYIYIYIYARTDINTLIDSTAIISRSIPRFFLAFFFFSFFAVPQCACVRKHNVYTELQSLVLRR